MNDADRFTRLYQEHYNRVLAFALRRASAEPARDAVDETFLIAWRRLADVPDEPLPWLMVVARNRISQHFRGARRADAAVPDAARLSVTVARDVGEAVSEREIVLRALEQLPEPDREVLMLVAWDGLSAGDAATVSGCSRATFRVRLHRARRRMRQALADLDAHHTALPSPLVVDPRSRETA